MNTKQFKTFVLDHWFDGLSAQQIANHPRAKELYSQRSSRDLTRNVIIGIVSRNGGLFKKGIKKKKKIGRVSFEELVEDIKQKKLELELQKENSKYRKRKCLSCEKTFIMEKNIYICDNCKKNYSTYGDVDSYEVLTY